MMLVGRQLAEALLLLLRRTEVQAKQIAFASGGFDIGELPIPAGKLKAYSMLREVDELDLIVAHVTDVRGGFGVSRAAVARWRKEIARGLRVMPVLAAQLEEAGALGDLELLAKRLATFERYRGTPYQEIAAQTGDAIANRRISQVTHHGNGTAKVGGNAGVGFAVDAAANEILSPWMIDTGQRAFEILIGRVLRASAKARRDGIRVAPHRAFAADRAGDPGPFVWEHVILPVVARSEGVVRIDYEAQWGSGKPVPDTWDEHAIYDSRGRRLAERRAA
jgi:hypothetical protein